MSAPATLEGLWQMVRAELDREAAPELVARRTEVELRAGNYVVFFDGQPVDTGTYEVADVSGTKTLMLRGASGPNSGRTIPCIFQLVGDRLRVCYGLGGVIPAEFATTAGQQRYLATYRRK